MGTFLIILIILFLIWPLIKRPVISWIQDLMSRRAEDMMRRMMGMPSRKEERRRNKARRSESQNRERKRKNAPQSPHPAAMMKSVAVDVEFTEVKEFRKEEPHKEDGNRKIKVEEQITDAEYTEFKD